MKHDARAYAQHTAVIREAQLAASQIAHGVTALGKATHAQPGFYTEAFFGLSIGLERMGKLIVLADYAIEHKGAFPTDTEMKKIGHNIEALLPKCGLIGNKVNPDREYRARPTSPIHQAIENTLSLFAKHLRYYNLTYLSGATTDRRDPISLWWTSVCEPILEVHYSEKARRLDEIDAGFMSTLMDGSAYVVHTSEEGDPIGDFSTFYKRGRANIVAQKYTRLYVLQIVRWLASIIYELSHEGAYTHQISPLLGCNEPFTIFYNDDRDLKKWKKWSIYP